MTTPRSGKLPLGTVLVLACAAGIAVGSNILNQPLLATLAKDFHTSESTATMSAPVSQIAYALGLLFLVPLADVMERRTLVISISCCVIIGLLLCATATRFEQFIIGTAITGIFAVTAMVLVASAPSLVSEEYIGRTVGSIMTGTLAGIFIGRMLSGFCSTQFSWQVGYYVAAALNVVSIIAIYRVFPPNKSAHPKPYGAVMKSLPRACVNYPRLITRGALGFFTFGAFTLIFVSLTLLLANEPYNFTDTAISGVTCAALAGVLAARLVGGLIDHGHVNKVSLAGLAVMALSSFFLSALNVISAIPVAVIVLCVGLFLLDFSTMAIHLSNQNVVLRLNPHARGAINSVYMLFYFGGAAVSSLIVAHVWEHFRWPGVCTMLVLYVIIVAGVLFADHKVEERS